MNDRIGIFVLLLAIGGCLLFSCGDGANSSGNQGAESSESNIPKGQFRVERIPTKKSIGREGELKWRIVPGENDLVMSCGITGSKGQGSSSSSGIALGQAGSSGVVITFTKSKMSGRSVLEMVSLLSGEENKEKLLEADPVMEKSHLTWFTLEKYSNTTKGEWKSTTEGLLPGSTRRAGVGGAFTSSEQKGVNLFDMGHRHVLASLIAADEDGKYGEIQERGSSEDRVTIKVSGKSIRIDEYEPQAWALWVAVSPKM